MRGLLVIFSFLFIGVATAIYVGFGYERPQQPIAIDKELEGLNEKYVIRFSHVVARNTPKGLAAAYFAKLVEEKTNGWVKVELYPNGVLYQAQEEFEALKKGEIEMIAPALSEITVHDPKWVVMDLPYLFDNEEKIEKAFDGQIGELLFESIEKRGYKGLAFWDNGFKQITNNLRPIMYPEDVEGLTIRVMPSDALLKTYRELNAFPRVHPFNEVYSLLKDEAIMGQENTLSNIYSKGFYQKQKYMTVSNHNYLGYAVLMNPEFWSSLPSEHQASIEEAMQEVTEWLRQHAKEIDEEMLGRIYDSGMIEIYVQTEDEKTIWRNALKSVYEEYEPIIGEEIMGEVRKLQQ
ncbi:TRAP transporter substrate-binding protein [Anaerobacillus sp. MEB173]|uniref:TRAP transporter substrate-binding protein n=1 Tax=Anaerobacillus sp. MEB173 TaxID=3383345 RepID=UPI003F8DA050